MSITAFQGVRVRACARPAEFQVCSEGGEQRGGLFQKALAVSAATRPAQTDTSVEHRESLVLTPRWSGGEMVQPTSGTFFMLDLFQQ